MGNTNIVYLPTLVVLGQQKEATLLFSKSTLAYIWLFYHWLNKNILINSICQLSIIMQLIPIFLII